jgi:thiopeptide-type bacteriocin biosynthesis protein
MSDGGQPRWLSAYLCIAPAIYSSDCDRIVRTVVRPFVALCRERCWIARYFFIRYSENGPHIRLRLHGEPAMLEQLVKPALIEHTASHGIAELRWLPYEPEVERYGGVDGVAVAEDQFEASSDTVLALLDRALPDDRRAKLGQALLAMVVSVHAFIDGRDRAALFAQQYGTGYLLAIARQEAQQARLVDAFGTSFRRQAESLIPFVQQTWEQLVHAEPLPSPLEEYHVAMRGIAARLRALCREGRIVREGRAVGDWDECVYRIVPAYIHMFNNRLGVPIPEESFLAYLLEHALQRPVGEAAPLGVAAEGGVQ